jgi:hypothetical protein
MNYPVKMGSGAMKYLQSFIKFGSNIEKYRQQGNPVSLLFYFKMGKVG